MRRCVPFTLALPLLAFTAPSRPTPATPTPLDEDFVREVAVEAYVYAFPMVLMEVTRRVSTNVEAPAGPYAPMNRFAHLRAFPDDTFKEVVRPNVDTLYSIVWFDVSEEPLVLTIPEGTERYHMMPMLDMWTDVFACPGTRTTGPEGGHFAITGPRWKGQLPEGVEAVRSPTAVGWIIGRTQTNGAKDYKAVHGLQDDYGLVPLSRFGKRAAAPRPGTVVEDLDVKTPPLAQVEAMSAKEFFELFAALLVDNPPHEVDWPILARMRRIGLVPGEPFEFSTLEKEVRQALAKGAERGRALIEAQAVKAAGGGGGAAWAMPTSGMGTYGSDYLQRAHIARIGLGANLVQDAVYPMSFVDDHGEPFDGGRAYRIHFDADELPPVRGFWSVTMYGADMYLVANPIGRYAIGDRDDLRFNDDGSLDLLVQHRPPAEEWQPNWLPAPAGRFDLVLRLYWPRLPVLVGEWVPPAVTRVDEG